MVERQSAHHCDLSVPIRAHRARPGVTPGYAARVLTIFSVPKPFEGRIGEIQRRAVESWTRLGDGVQVLLLGDEAGTDEAARDAGAEHLPDLARTEHGTPRL